MIKGILYEKGGKIFNKNYVEIYIPTDYFENKRFAVDKGNSIEALGLLYIREYPDGNAGPIHLLNVPTIFDLFYYDSRIEEIKIHGRTIEVMTLKYLPDSYIFHQSIQKGREVAEAFLDFILMGKLPHTLDYARIIDIWWRNLEISGISFKVPSKIFEMIIANIYRHPTDPKRRFGELYGRSSPPNGYNYKTGNVRDVVGGLSTFSGMVYEDINQMITRGINNSMEGIEEARSPLEKVIYY